MILLVLKTPCEPPLLSSPLLFMCTYQGRQVTVMARVASLFLGLLWLLLCFNSKELSFFCSSFCLWINVERIWRGGKVKERVTHIEADAWAVGRVQDTEHWARKPHASAGSGSSFPSLCLFPVICLCTTALLRLSSLKPTFFLAAGHLHPNDI